MTNEEIQRLLSEGLEASHVRVGGDGSHFDVIVVSERFNGLTPVKKQQLVYSVLNPYILDGSLHAVNMKTYTPDEWAKQQ